MSMFPKIRHLNDMLPFISANPQFRVQEQPNGHTVVCYMLKDEDTFRGEHAFWYQECRGITFAPDGTVSSRTLHKFPNVGENAESQPHLISWQDIKRVMDKRDGSMITFVLMEDGTVKGKTKKTFTSAEAIAATEWLHQIVTDEHGHKDQPYLEWVRQMLLDNYTPTFEWTSPRFPIVLLYEKDELTLLQIRDNIFGSYKVRMFEDEAFIRSCPFPIVENIIDQFSSGGVVMWEYFEREMLNRTGTEGWIIQAEDGRMWKAKTKWYCELHHSVTFTRYRDVARVILDDKSDDLKAAFALTGRSIEPIEKLEREIFDVIARYEKVVSHIVMMSQACATSAKEMAASYGAHRLFREIMREFRGQKVDWLDFYLKNHIRDHSLEVITEVGLDDMPEPVEGEE